MKQDTEQFKRNILPLQPAMQRMAESLLHSEEDAADNREGQKNGQDG